MSTPSPTQVQDAIGFLAKTLDNMPEPEEGPGFIWQQDEVKRLVEDTLQLLGVPVDDPVEVPSIKRPAGASDEWEV